MSMGGGEQLKICLELIFYFILNEISGLDGNDIIRFEQNSVNIHSMYMEYLYQFIKFYTRSICILRYINWKRKYRIPCIKFECTNNVAF